MGVKDLWNILAPVAHKTTLYELEGKTVAVDLSCWVCEGQAVGERVDAQPRMYLRNLFFRTQLLINFNVKPIFVLDGEAPALKLDTIQQRNQIRFKNRLNVANESNGSKGRSRTTARRGRFRGILKTCQSMLELMGVSCIESCGEAEALCGQLNRTGVVDGVITQDSDVFLYGARVVYRNFTVKAGTGTIEIYNMDNIERKLNLTREKLVAMSLLCGCDYDQAGVHGVGKESAYKYLAAFSGNILQRLSDWSTDKTLIRYEEERSSCTKCCHAGKASNHRKDGCLHCGTDKGCLENYSPLCFKNLSDDEKEKAILELSIRRKALTQMDFPNQGTVKEFLSFHQDSTIVISWQKPNVPKFCLYSKKMLEWELDYAFEKILPLLTRWLLLHTTLSGDIELVPEKLTKKRIVKGVPSFDVQWKVEDENISGFLSLLTHDCRILVDGNCCTTEPSPLVESRMSDLYIEYSARTAKKPNERKTRQKKKDVPPAVKDKKKKMKGLSGGSESDITIETPTPDEEISSAMLQKLKWKGNENDEEISSAMHQNLNLNDTANGSDNSDHLVPNTEAFLTSALIKELSIDHGLPCVAKSTSSSSPTQFGESFSDISVIFPISNRKDYIKEQEVTGI